jgi:hypothetical protein
MTNIDVWINLFIWIEEQYHKRVFQFLETNYDVVSHS